MWQDLYWIKAAQMTASRCVHSQGWTPGVSLTDPECMDDNHQDNGVNGSGSSSDFKLRKMQNI